MFNVVSSFQRSWLFYQYCADYADDPVLYSDLTDLLPRFIMLWFNRLHYFSFTVVNSLVTSRPVAADAAHPKHCAPSGGAVQCSVVAVLLPCFVLSLKTPGRIFWPFGLGSSWSWAWFSWPLHRPGRPCFFLVQLEIIGLASRELFKSLKLKAIILLKRPSALWRTLQTLIC